MRVTIKDLRCCKGSLFNFKLFQTEDLICHRRLLTWDEVLNEKTDNYNFASKPYG
jgi:hypothetical protein